MIVIPTAFIVLYLLILFYVLCYQSALAHETIWIVLFAIGAGICALLLLLGVLHLVRAAISRLRFASELRRLTRRAGGECRFLHSPLRSFFFPYAGADIVIANGEKKYAIKFFPRFIRNYTVHIADEKTAYFSKSVALFWQSGTRHTIWLGRGNAVENEFSFGKRKINLHMDEEGEHIVLLSPACRKITATVANRAEAVDNGYEWQGMTFWYQKSFFKFLEREEIL